MKPPRKKIMIIAGCIATLIVLAAIVGSLLFDINSYKPRIETAASGAIGLDVTIKGKLRLSFFPFGVSAKDIHVAGNGVEILSVEKLKLGAAFIPLLKKQLKITGCEVYKPTLTIVKDTGGKYVFNSAEKKPVEKGMETGFSLKKLKLSHGVLVYVDKKTDDKTELKDITLTLSDLLVADTSADILKNVSFEGTFHCKALRKGDLIIDDIVSPIKADKGLFTLKPLAMDIFGTKGKGDAAADMSGVHIKYHITLKVPNLDFSNLEESIGAKKVIGGKGDLNASLTMEDKANHTLMSTMAGTFSLRGDHLVIYTMDLDEVLSTYETSQQFNIVDIGAFFIAGPLGTAGLKGYGYWDTYDETRKGQGDITQFVSHWEIKEGIAEAMDCALSTQNNRVALKGRLNLVDRQYENVTMALLDERGCTKLKQSITGPFGKPEVGAVSMVRTLGGPIFNIYNKAKRLIQGDNCEVFYDGSVRQP